MECEQRAEYVFVYIPLTSSAELSGFYDTFFRARNKVTFDLINESSSFSVFALLFRW